ncbi:MAG: DUF438 domain-containing protein [Clostridiaceae bacterium]|nr:DUF438 domain-containing protein [Clostridiaceae bacterium]
MSELINNREYRKQVLKELIGELHKGKTIDEVKSRFEELIEGGVTTAEITEMEAALVAEGLPVEEIQRLCDVHAAVFKGSIEDIHKSANPAEIPGHPVNIFFLENRAIEDLIVTIEDNLALFKSEDSKAVVKNLKENFDKLWEIDKHYARKENLLFPYLEKYGISTPPKVMWGVDDDIRDDIKAVMNLLKDYSGNKEEVIEKAEYALERVNEMIFKEESILFPLAIDTLSEDEWLQVHKSSKEIGYTLIKPRAKWVPARVDVEEKAREEGEEPSNDGYVDFDAGIMTPEEINAVLNTIPIDLTFVDKDGIVKWFSMGKERIFARPKTVLGRRVENCHPPASVHVVEKIVEDLKSGKKDHEDFWIRMGERFVYIRYFAVRDKKGKFLGVLEVTQDIKPIQEITGEKRLLSE